MPTILSVQSVSYAYGNRRRQHKLALDNVSAEFDAGTLYAIVGKSGSGKTTLLSLLAGLDDPQTGTILFENTNMQTINKNKYRRKNAAVIYQDYNLFPLLNAEENVMYPLLLEKIPISQAKEQARATLSILGLDETYYQRFPSTLSGGEQQRVAIARALAMQAKILLADEPTGNLDEENTEVFLDILSEATSQRGICTIIATHDKEAAEKASKVYRLSKGVIQPPK